MSTTVQNQRIIPRAFWPLGFFKAHHKKSAHSVEVINWKKNHSQTIENLNPLDIGGIATAMVGIASLIFGNNHENKIFTATGVLATIGGVFTTIISSIGKNAFSFNDPKIKPTQNKVKCALENENKEIELLNLLAKARNGNEEIKNDLIISAKNDENIRDFLLYLYKDKDNRHAETVHEILQLASPGKVTSSSIK